MANILLVEAGADGANNGTTWANAYNNLHDAIAAATPGDSIHVAQGVYRPDQGVGVNSGNRNATFQLLSGVAIRGGYAGYGEPNPDVQDFLNNPTILSGDLSANDSEPNLANWQAVSVYARDPSLSDNSYNVVTARNTDSTAILEGFIIIAGRTDNSAPTPGPAMLIDDANPTLSNCTFKHNTAYIEDAVVTGGAVFNNGDPTFTNCLFIENAAFGANSTASGGAIYNDHASPTYVSCTFTGNIATGYDSAYYAGAIYSRMGQTDIDNCTFTENTSGYNGGALYADDAILEISGSTFENNTAIQSGAAIYCTGGGAAVSTTTFAENAAGYDGGAIAAENAELTVTQTSFSDNFAQYGGAVSSRHSIGPADIDHCIFNGNIAEYSGGALYAWDGGIRVNDCRFDGNFARTGGAFCAEDCPYAEVKVSTFTSNRAITSQSKAGAIANIATNTSIIASAFTSNQALDGGAVYNQSCTPSIVGCTFARNFATTGGAMSNHNANTRIQTTSFAQNGATGQGGAVYNTQSSPHFIECSFAANDAQYGGAMYFTQASRYLIERSYFLSNVAWDCGGAIAAEQNSVMPIVADSLFTANYAGNRGGAVWSIGCDLSVENSTISANFAENDAGGIFNSGNTLKIHNSILWANNTAAGNSLASQVTVGNSITAEYCCIQHHLGQFGANGNISDDPQFANALGRDLHLKLGSPCIDAGTNYSISPADTDLDNKPRIVRSTVDIGAYEFQGPFIWYVDARSGNDNNNGFRMQTAFATINKGMQSAGDSDTVAVLPGTYTEEIRFLGKAVTLQGLAVEGEIAVIHNPTDFAVSFYQGEGPDSILRNFVIADSLNGVFIAGSAPTITNVTFVNNIYGAASYAGADARITNCIFYNNLQGDLDQCDVVYSRTTIPAEGPGNITGDPLFADPNAGDYHLRSQRGRFRPSTGEWILDKTSSPCIDAADPTIRPYAEKIPNGAFLNMGAFGDTEFASMSEWSIKGDADYDGRVDMRDFAIVLDNWLEDVRTDQP